MPARSPDRELAQLEAARIAEIVSAEIPRLISESAERTGAFLVPRGTGDQGLGAQIMLHHALIGALTKTLHAQGRALVKAYLEARRVDDGLRPTHAIRELEGLLQMSRAGVQFLFGAGRSRRGAPKTDLDDADPTGH